MSRLVYYLPGQGGRLTQGLGDGLLQRGLEVIGRETVTDFRDLDFSEKLALIKKDLVDKTWDEQGVVIANSFGAYLFLHAQADLPPFPGKVLLLSPIVGGFVNEDAGIVFSPPRPDRLLALAARGEFPAPSRCEIHVGSVDWQSDPANVQRFGTLTNIQVVVVPDKGHVLGKEYVSQVLDTFLAREN